MAHATQTTPGPAQHPSDDAMRTAQLLGREQLAGAVLMVVGLFHVVQGIAAFAGGGPYTRVDYEYAYNLDAWGWGLVLLGLVVAGIGLSLLLDQEWARIIGILVAMFSALVSFMLVPQFPVWALLVVALDVVAVWSITAVIGLSRPL